MKKWFIPACILLILVAIAFIPVRRTYQLSINSSYFNVYHNLALAENWVKWYPYFKGNNIKFDNNANSFSAESSSSAIHLQTIGLGAFNIKVSGGTATGLYDCVVTTTDTANLTKVLISHQAKMPGYLWQLVKGDSKDAFIYKLKNYLEDTKTYYGFMITKQSTTDQFLIVKPGKYLTCSVCQNNIETLKQLKAIAGKFKLNTSGALRLQYVSTTNDSTDVMLGISVAEKNNSVNKTVQYMQMPGSKVLAGSFKGKYKDRQKLYRALYLYMSDHNMHQQTKPYETFTNNTLPLNDESIVDMQVIVPYV